MSAGVSLKVDYSDLQRIEKMFRRLSRLDKREISDEIGSYMVDEIVARFESQRTWDGKKFIQSKAAKKRSGLTLVDIGHLRDSYTYQIEINGDEVQIGSDLDYAARQHFGGQGLKDKLGRTMTNPANPVLGLNADDEAEIGDIVLKQIRQSLR